MLTASVPHSFMPTAFAPHSFMPTASVPHSFRYTSQVREKLNTLVDFPLGGEGDILDMSPHVIGGQSVAELQYELRAVSHHSGSMGGGQ